MRRHDRLQEHLWTSMDLGKERKKSTPEVGVKTRHLVRVAHPEALQGKNPCLFAGLGISDGRKASQAASGRHAQRRQPRSTIHVVNPPFRTPVLPPRPLATGREASYPISSWQ